MDIERDIFEGGSAQEIADSLKHSSERSKRRKGTPFQSAMSMLNFYINRAGRNLPKTRRAHSIAPRSDCVKRSGASLDSAHDEERRLLSCLPEAHQHARSN